MAGVFLHVSRLLRVVAAALSVCAALAAAPLAAQGPAANPNSPDSAPGNLTPLPATAQAPRATALRVVDIRIEGNRSITLDKVIANIGTQKDKPFDQVTFENDIRKLSAKNWFVHVNPRRDYVPGGIIITLEVVERPTVQYVHYWGAKKIKAKILAKETGLKVSDSLDPYAVTDGARKIETLYMSKGYNDVKVSILEGDKPSDKGVVYMIHESQIQRFSKISFVGNTVAPDGRLKTLIQSKKPILWIFKGQVDRQKMEEDVEKLTDYYRSLGYFKAHVGRDYEFNEKEDKMQLTFYINEGPRYRVRNVSMIGNKVYPEQALTSDLKLTPGSYFDRSKMTTDVGNFKDLYGSNGYVFADAVAALQFFEEPGELDIVYQVTEGKQYRIGEINIQIKGENAHTRYATVLNRLSMRPGDIANIRDFRSSERRLKASQLYNVDPSKGEVPRIVFSPPDSEESLAATKKRASAKRTGNPDTFRGQSPDGPPPARPPGNPAPQYSAAPQSNAAPQYTPPPARPVSQGEFAPAPFRKSLDTPTVRAQSPDSYGGYGGRTVNSISPGPQPYTVAQPTDYSSAPNAAPPSNGSYAPGYGTLPAPQNGPVYQPAYPNQPGYQPGYQNPPVYQNQGPPPGPGYSQPPLVGGGNIIGGPTFPEALDQPAIPIDVIVNEAQTGKFMFGAGVNSNAGLVGSIVLDEQNFDWRRLPTSWEDFRNGRAFRGAGQKFRIEAAPGTQVQRYLFSFAEPFLFDTPVAFGLSGWYFNRFYRSWSEQRMGGRSSLGYQFTPDLSGNVSFRAEDVLLGNLPPAPPPDLTAAEGHTSIYSWKFLMAHDTRDSTFLATEGHYIEADFEYAIGTFQFPRFTTNYRQHFLLRQRPDGSGRHTLSFYNQFGISGNDTPIYERFFAGGFSTLRGYQFRGASPMINNVEVGGFLENLSSVEYMFPITADDMLKGVFFCDFGTVEKGYSIDWDNFRVAPGFGLRVTIPMISMAPIALDFAFPVHSAPTDLEQMFSFFVGVAH